MLIFKLPMNSKLMLNTMFLLLFDVPGYDK